MDNTGPDINNLRRLAEMLPDYVQARAQRKIKVKGRNPKFPEHVCRICGRPHGAGSEGKTPGSQVCQPCQQRLDAGQSAIVGDGRYAFVVSESLQDKETHLGTINHVTKAVMDNVMDRFGMQQIQKRHDASEESSN